MPRGVYERTQGDELKRRLARIKEAQAAPLTAKEAVSVSLISGLASPRVVLFSGGRDSTIVAHLAARLGPVTLIYCDTGLSSPGARARVDEVARLLGLPLVVVEPKVPAFAMWADLGHYPIGPKRGHTYLKQAVPGLRTSPVQCCYHLKEAPARAAMRQLSAGCLLWGNRAADSDRRKLALADYGLVQETKRWPCPSAEPIAFWTDADVEAFLLARLPWISWESKAETGCRCCCTDLARPDNQLSRLFLEDRAAFDEAIRSGLGAEILRANGDQVDVEQALAQQPGLFLRLRPAGKKR
jgi:3'-phosphoadenosine 5'-phosphosulfate sulfotransferase (PAPS reductase)/FAD synthetase